MHKTLILFLIVSIGNSVFGQDLKPETPGLRKTPLWISSFESRGFESSSMEMAEDGSIYIGGTFQSLLILSDTAYEIRERNRQSYPNHIMVQKHDLNGQREWTVYAEGQARLRDLILSKDGSVLVCGEVWSPNLVFVSANGQRDSLSKKGDFSHGIYVARLSSDGVLMAANFINPFGYDNAESLVEDSEGRIVLGGHHLYNVDQTLTRNWLLIRLFPDFNEDFILSGDSSGRSSISSVLVDSRDNIYAGGWFAEHLKVDDRVFDTESSYQQGWIAKFEEDLSLDWINAGIRDKDLGPLGITVKEIQFDKRKRVYFSGNQSSRLGLGRLSRRGNLDWFSYSQGRSNYSFGLNWKDDRRKQLLVFGHGYGGDFYNAKEELSYSYQSSGSTDGFLLELNRKSRLGEGLVFGGEGTEYITDLRWLEGKLYILGHSLGGPEVVIGDQRLRSGKAKMWIACWDWP